MDNPVTFRGLVFALVAFASSHAARAQDSARQSPHAVCHVDSIGTDTTTDTLFAWVPEQASGESDAEHALWIAQLRAALAALEPLPVLGPPVRLAPPNPAPPPGPKRLLDARVLIWFQVRNDGRLAGLHLHSRSGWDTLDIALQRAVLRADTLRTLRPLPPSLVGQPIDLWLAVGLGRLGSALNLPVARVRWITPRLTGGETQPRLLSVGYRPRFPDAALRAGIGDMLVMEFVIDTAGRAEPNSIIPLRGRFREFAEEAVKAIRSARFAPGRLGECPIRVRVQMPVNFVFLGR